MQTPYEKDPYAWSQEQAHLLRSGEFKKLDIENLAEEIEDLARSNKSSIRNYTIRLLMHKLKLTYQPEGQGNSHSWDSSIYQSVIHISLLLEDSPSLKNELIRIYDKAYEYAKKQAAIETGLDIKTFPKECPWTIDEILGE